MSKLPPYTRLPPDDTNIYVHYRCDMEVVLSDATSGHYSIVVVSPTSMGRVPAATVTVESIRRWHPRYVLLVGIAAGIEQRVSLGDVLVPDLIGDYAVSKVSPDKVEIRPQSPPVDQRLLVNIKNFRGEWIHRIGVKRPRRGQPQRHIGPIASGDTIVAARAHLDQLLAHWPKLIGLEMEAGGAAGAAAQAAVRPGFIMIRGVSDFADEAKGSGPVEAWRDYACHAAAAYTVAWLQSGPVSINSVAANDGEAATRKARLTELLRESRGRCISSWQGAGVPRLQAIELADDESLGTPFECLMPTLDNPLRLLVGGLGDGKSLLGERLLQGVAHTASHAGGAMLPVYIDARYLDVPLRVAIEKNCESIGDHRAVGCLVFIDEIDQTGRSLDVLLAEARAFVETFNNTHILIASRTLPIEGRTAEVIEVPRLSHEQASSLIQRLTETPTSSPIGWRWPESIRDAIQRPLFAVLLSTYLREHQNQPLPPHLSTVELVSALVTKALARLPPAARTTHIRELLGHLARMSTDRGGQYVPTAEIAPAEELTPLAEVGLVVLRGPSVGFPLPLLTEWFASQALLLNPALTSAISADPLQLRRWRYPLSIALVHSSYEVARELLEPIVVDHPAEAARIIKEGLEHWPVSDSPFPRTLEFGERMLHAMRHWVKGIGPLALLLAPVRKDGELKPFGITSGGSHMVSAWYSGEENLPPIVPLPEEVLEVFRGLGRDTSGSPGGQRSPFGWGTFTLESASSNPAWAWNWALKHLRSSLVSWLKTGWIPMANGPLLDEAAWRVALIATNRGRSDSTPIPVTRLEKLLQRARSYPDNFSFMTSDPRQYSPHPLIKKVDTLLAAGRGYLDPPWPAPDRLEHPGASTVWDWYSTEQLLARTQAVYEGALEGYINLLDVWFSSFYPDLALANKLPAALFGALELTDWQPRLFWYWKPLPQGARSHVSIHLGGREQLVDDLHQKFRSSTDTRNMTQEEVSFRALAPLHTAPPDILGVGCMTAIAYRWLWDDLHPLGWVDGSFSRPL